MSGVDGRDDSARPDPGPAVRALRAMAERGDPAVMEMLAQRLLDARIPDEAQIWLSRAAELGSSTAMGTLGTLARRDGRIAEAITWLERGAAAGNDDAAQQLGILHLERGDPDSAERWLRSAAEAGLPEAMCNMGAIADRRGDDAAAERWYERAARAHEPTAMRNLAIRLARRDEITRATELLEDSFRRGRTDAAAVLGTIHLEHGDTEAGERWLRRGIESGDPTSMVRLALHLREAKEPERHQESDLLLERAAAAGHPLALEILHH
ncbi:tetratricopeptide repeat protein [Nocardia sp. BMG111209]|uniref:tetratricopeptide repeat protein n=1 Tax=Nocardia sp. BMG111209 TaxID=1160137 RepID=UPI00037E24D6|nr:tetratricopeptide repeat protein [Nocardia sp. BMG111209]